MSFQVNNKELSAITFNGKDVEKVQLLTGTSIWTVWRKSDAPLSTCLEEISWNRIYNTAKQRQNGQLAEWPAAFKLGAIKKLNFSQNALRGFGIYDSTTGTYDFNIPYVYVRIIGLDVDGPGTITFQALSGGRGENTWNWDNYPDGGFNMRHFKILSSKPAGTEVSGTGKWISSTIREELQKAWQCSEIKDYVKPVLKGTCPRSNWTSEGRTITPNYNEETFWLLSLYEMGFDGENSPCDAIELKETTYLPETGTYAQPYSCSWEQFHYNEYDGYYYGLAQGRDGCGSILRTMTAGDAAGYNQNGIYCYGDNWVNHFEYDGMFSDGLDTSISGPLGMVYSPNSPDQPYGTNTYDFCFVIG